MTIVVCAVTPDGIVLAADSRQLVETASGPWRVDSDQAQKIFKLNAYMGVAILGQGTFYVDRGTSPRSIRSLIRQAARDLPQDGCSVENAATLLHTKITHDLQIHQAALSAERAGLAFYVGGYNGPEAERGELWRCDIPGDIALERTTADAGLVWGGQREIVDRLILGVDPRMGQILADEPANEMFGKLRPKLQLLINFQTMPLQDAVDLATLLVRTTIEMQRFSDGIVGKPGYVAGCGGTVDVAVITPDQGFQ